MKKFTLLFAILLSAVMVKAQEKTVVDIAKNSSDHAILVQAVVASELAETLSSEGPFTVFAPTDDAFKKLPEGTLEELLKPENQRKLQTILTYHVLSGEFSSEAVGKAIEEQGGRATLKTVQGQPIYAAIDGGNIVLIDGTGSKSTITALDLKAGNGMVHVIDTVVMP